CPPLLGLTPGILEKPRADCRLMNVAVADYLRANVPRGVVGVFLVSRWPRYVTRVPGMQIYFDIHDSTLAASLESERRGLERTLDLADSLAVRVLILLPPPESSFQLADCLIVRGVEGCGATRVHVVAQRAATARVIREVVAH